MRKGHPGAGAHKRAASTTGSMRYPKWLLSPREAVRLTRAHPWRAVALFLLGAALEWAVEELVRHAPLW